MGWGSVLALGITLSGLVGWTHAICGRGGNEACQAGQCCGADGFCGLSKQFCSQQFSCQLNCWSCGNGNCEGVLEEGGETCGTCPLDCGPCTPEKGIIRACVDPKAYAITFDDGPSSKCVRAVSAKTNNGSFAGCCHHPMHPPYRCAQRLCRLPGLAVLQHPDPAKLFLLSRERDAHTG